VAVAAVVAALPVAARPLTIVTDPEPATWHDRVVVTVSGTVVTACGPEIVTLTLAGEAGGSPTPLLLDLVESTCPLAAPATSHPFTVAAELPRLVVGSYLVVVRDQAMGGEESTAPLLVHDVSAIRIGVPEAATSEEPAVLRLLVIGACPGADVEVVEGRIEIAYSDQCAVLPPDSRVVEIEAPVGPLPPGTYPVAVFDLGAGPDPANAPVARAILRVWDAEECVPSATALCLQEGRFRVEVAWEKPNGATGSGQAVPLEGRDDSGLFWFFNPANVELTVKVLPGCSANGRWWVFLSGLSNVEYEVTVTDTRADVARAYGNGQGQFPVLTADTATFATCP
jgi:hypothetical protein